MNYMIL